MHDTMVEEVQADVNELRRIAFCMEEALEKTPRGVSMERPTVLFVKKALLDYADDLELQ